jgi:uncharacterized membrane protein YdjX (TVP38/TMEM64 family)
MLDFSQVDFSSIDSTVAYLKSFGIFSTAITFLIFFIQAIAPVIPYMIIAGAAGMVFGKLHGFLLAWVGALAGAMFLYESSKRLGSDAFLKKIQEKYHFDLRDVDERYTFWVLLICRIFPVVPTPIINIGSGIGGVSTRVFFLSSAIGKIPWALIYVSVGDYFIQSKNLSYTLMMIGAILIFSVIGISIARRKLPSFRKDEENEKDLQHKQDY